MTYKIAAKNDYKKQITKITIKNLQIDGTSPLIIAGPCAVESEAQILLSAHKVKKAGANILRGGAYKPRTSPYSFQGLEKKGLQLLQKASKETSLPVVSEVIDERSLDLGLEYLDMIQIGSRNMQNFSLLKAAGRTKKPVLLKRGLSATIEEWLLAAEYILSEGNSQVILCERGIRTFETATRNTLDLSAVALAKSLSHLPVIVDPSHATGHRHLVLPMSLAAIAAGADGLIIEMHPNPSEALSDGEQSLHPYELENLVQRVHDLYPHIHSSKNLKLGDVVNA